jgi:hypothetical protein
VGRQWAGSGRRPALARSAGGAGELGGPLEGNRRRRSWAGGVAGEKGGAAAISERRRVACAVSENNREETRREKGVLRIFPSSVPRSVAPS